MDGLKAKNELKQYLTSINLIYAKYTEDVWAEEVDSAAAWKPIMHAYGDVYDTLYLLLIPTECTPSNADVILRITR